MKNWWDNLTQRERLLVIIGTAAAFLLIFYFFIWTPFTNSVSALQQQTQQQRSLLAWMQTRSKQLQQDRATGKATATVIPSSLLGFVNQSTRQHRLAGFVTQMQETPSNQVAVKFKTVPFDQLAHWLQSIWHEHAVTVVDFELTPTKTSGLVEANLTLEAKR